MGIIAPSPFGLTAYLKSLKYRIKAKEDQGSGEETAKRPKVRKQPGGEGGRSRTPREDISEASREQEEAVSDPRSEAYFLNELRNTDPKKRGSGGRPKKEGVARTASGRISQSTTGGQDPRANKIRKRREGTEESTQYATRQRAQHGQAIGEQEGESHDEAKKKKEAAKKRKEAAERKAKRELERVQWQGDQPVQRIPGSTAPGLNRPPQAGDVGQPYKPAPGPQPMTEREQRRYNLYGPETRQQLNAQQMAAEHEAAKERKPQVAKPSNPFANMQNIEHVGPAETGYEYQDPMETYTQNQIPGLEEEPWAGPLEAERGQKVPADQGEGWRHFNPVTGEEGIGYPGEPVLPGIEPAMAYRPQGPPEVPLTEEQLHNAQQFAPMPPGAMTPEGLAEGPAPEKGSESGWRYWNPAAKVPIYQPFHLGEKLVSDYGNKEIDEVDNILHTLNIPTGLEVVDYKDDTRPEMEEYNQQGGMAKRPVYDEDGKLVLSGEKIFGKQVRAILPGVHKMSVLGAEELVEQLLSPGPTKVRVPMRDMEGNVMHDEEGETRTRMVVIHPPNLIDAKLGRTKINGKVVPQVKVTIPAGTEEDYYSGLAKKLADFRFTDPTLVNYYVGKLEQYREDLSNDYDNAPPEQREEMAQWINYLGAAINLGHKKQKKAVARQLQEIETRRPQQEKERAERAGRQGVANEERKQDLRDIRRRQGEQKPYEL